MNYLDLQKKNFERIFNVKILTDLAKVNNFEAAQDGVTKFLQHFHDLHESWIEMIPPWFYLRTIGWQLNHFLDNIVFYITNMRVNSLFD